ncbi:MAG: hypothetical protein MI725_04875, partial [Pirellulales bacterium]|nr:hypothetical protein [Pirellulales bacterium]
MRGNLRTLGFLLGGIVSLSADVGAWAEGNPAWAGQMQQLVRQLNDDQAARRDEAEQALLELAPTGNAERCDDFLARLPRPTEDMPAEARLRLARLRKDIETQQAKQALAASRLTLSAKEMELQALLEEIHRQTGNRLSDYRKQFGQPVTPLQITLEVDEEPFWSGLDKILDQAGLSLYPFSGEESLAIIQREQGAAPRTGRGTYAGPFRIEAVNIVSQRNLR